MPKNVPKPENEHPAEYAADLNPEPLAGRNVGSESPHSTRASARSAEDYKEAHTLYPHLDKDHLRSIPIVPPGERLKQGATYFDLHNPQRGEIQATANIEAGPDNWYVPKSEVNYELWNILIGVRDPQRLNQADEPGTNA